MRLKSADFILGLSLLAASGADAQSRGKTSFETYPWPAPKYTVRLERSLEVPMRDGVRLSTDLYFPKELEGRLPVILIRTPYDKNALRRLEWDYALAFSRLGYVVAAQDTRGRFESEGEYLVQGGDVNDGYDAIDWLAKQPWSNGRIGMIGCSYPGDVQILTAKTRHPALKALIPQSAGSSIGGAAGRYYHFGTVKGGVAELAGGVDWFVGNGTKLFLRRPASWSREQWLPYADLFTPGPTRVKKDLKPFFSILPVVDIMDRIGAPPNDFNQLLLHGPTDPWWRQFGYLAGDERFDVPALHVNSWYDFGVAETLLEFELFRTNAVSDESRNNQFTVIGPTAHCRSEFVAEETVVGARPMGDARFDHRGLYVQWFDHWLKGVDNGVTERPKVQIFVMGRNQWRSENEWPLARTKWTQFYLHSAGRANGSAGDGTLSVVPPRNEPLDEFVYDPAAPVPSRGGPVCCTIGSDDPEGSYDQRPVEVRHDVLVYSTPPLEQGLEVTGPLKLVLFVSSSAKDTDFTGKLVDVYPDGTAYNVQEGIARARYREGYDRDVFMEPGQVYRLEIDLEATSNYFGPGHRIRLEVSSSNFPRFARNTNTGGNPYTESTWVTARNQVRHDARYPAHLVLPIIPAHHSAPGSPRERAAPLARP